MTEYLQDDEPARVDAVHIIALLSLPPRARLDLLGLDGAANPYNFHP